MPDVFNLDDDLDLELEKIDEDLIVDNSIKKDDDIFDEPSKEIKNDLVSSLLKNVGIEDGKISILNEKEEEELIDFSELSLEEQLEILSNSNSNEYDLDDSEIELINTLRENNLSIKELVAQKQQEAIEAYLEENSMLPEDNYEIDSFNDQELFLLDLKNKFDLTDEELEKELDKELQDEALFKKKVDRLREEYKQLEDSYKEQQKLIFEQEQEENYNKFSDTLVNVAINSPILYDIELEDDEKNRTLSTLLDLDENGVSEFYRKLKDPKTLYEAAWFLTYGKEAFDAIKSDYEEEIKQLKKKDKASVVVTKPNPTTKKQRNIHDLFD